MTATLEGISFEKQKTEEWSYIFDSFDRSPNLSKSEKSALASWEASWQVPYKNREKLELALRRLTKPIRAALNQFQFKEVYIQRSTVGLMLLEMHRRQTSFWTWREQEWLEIIGVTAGGYRAYGHIKKVGVRRPLTACAYLLYDSNILLPIRKFQHQQAFAGSLFGDAQVQAAVDAVQTEGLRLGLGKTTVHEYLPAIISEALLLSRSAVLTGLSLSVFEQLQRKYTDKIGRACVSVTRILHNLHVLPRSLKRQEPPGAVVIGGDADSVPAEWFAFVERWYTTSTKELATRKGKRGLLLKAGRWFAATFPGRTSPAQWDRDVSLAYVAAVDRMTAGEWNYSNDCIHKSKIGNPLRPNTKSATIAAVRVFFLDCHDWQWLPATFNARRYLASPRSIENLRGPDPRTIADVWWKKLMNAAITLTKEDLPVSRVDCIWYPFEYTRAIALVWVFAGLRANEIERLRLGCARSQELAQEDSIALGSEKISCLLDVPVGKTANAFCKPVDPMVGAAILEWEKVRPASVKQCDAKTGQMVDFLFIWRGKRLSRRYINLSLIPLLCRKAGIPESDARGPITSHRARATIASQLYNAPEGMSLPDLGKWMGHATLSATRHYVTIAPTKLAKAYSDANNNVRMIDVLIDKEAIRNGTPAAGQPWLLYDLGHGYCSNDVFAQCAHRMACARCSFYQPKDSAYAQMLEAKGNLLRMKQSMPLLPDELAVIDEDLGALEKLTAHLRDVPTPQGLTPRELHG